jgi:hypothetical protein
MSEEPHTQEVKSDLAEATAVESQRADTANEQALKTLGNVAAAPRKVLVDGRGNVMTSNEVA